MKNAIMEFILRILAGEFTLVTNSDESQPWNKHDYWNGEGTLIATNGTGANEIYPDDILDSGKPVLITPGGLKILREHVEKIEEERDALRSDMAAIQRTKELLG